MASARAAASSSTRPRILAYHSLESVSTITQAKMRRERMITTVIGFPSMLHRMLSTLAVAKAPYLATGMPVAFDQFDV